MWVRAFAMAAAAIGLGAGAVWAQTAAGSPSGTVFDSVRGRPLDSARASASRAQVLDSVRVTARAAVRSRFNREFDERERSGSGEYITEDMIRRQAPLATMDLFRRLRDFTVLNGNLYSNRGVDSLPILAPATPGIGSMVGIGATPSDGMSNPTARAPLCSPTIYLDGSPVVGGIYAVRPDQIYGIEVYPSATAPSKYRGSLCGVVLIWSK